MRVPKRPVAILAVVLAACSEPTSPPVSAHPSFARSGAYTEHGAGVLTYGDQPYFACLGEVFSYTATAPYTYQLTVTPNGRTNYAWHFVPHAGTATGVGLTSGTTWTATKSISPEVDQVSSDGGRFHWTALAEFVSETGPTLRIHTNFLLEQNAAGELTVVRSTARVRCV